jgi:hypothetical protein
MEKPLPWTRQTKVTLLSKISDSCYFEVFEKVTRAKVFDGSDDGFSRSFIACFDGVCIQWFTPVR